MNVNKIATCLTSATLDAKWKSNPDAEQRDNALNLRMCRALSWLARAE